MNRALTKDEMIDLNRKYLMNSIRQLQPTAYTLNVKLANNPFLKNQDKFQFLIYQLNEYNKRVDRQQVTDRYEMASYEKLHSMISDLAQIQTKNDQVQVLTDVYQWFREQNRLIEQRKNQGQIRYEITNDYRKYTKIPQQSNHNDGQQKKQFQLPCELIDRLLQPFRWGNRTTHKQFDIPLRRLNQYKRKVINIAPFIEVKQIVQPPRVLYPKPPKYQPKQEQEQVKQGQEQENKQVVEGQEGQSIIQNQQGNQQQGQQQQASQNFGLLGQDLEDPQDQQPAEQVIDKLAPKNKIYVSAIVKPVSNQKFYRGQYMSYKGQQNHSQRSLEQRYFKLQEQLLVKQREDKLNIELANERARKKSKMVKEIQKKLQDMMHRPKYIFSEEEAKPHEKLSKEDELKFGFTMQVRRKPKHNQIDLTNTTSFPKIHDNSFDQKTIRRDRIKSLKSKFSKLLNLSEYQEREVGVSMCQYTTRKRGFSEIIKNHSKSKERISQLDEVTRIKEKLTRNKIGVNIRALSQGLCLPESQQNVSPTPENIFPNKQLPSNPFMVETKKKKKKK